MARDDGRDEQTLVLVLDDVGQSIQHGSGRVAVGHQVRVLAQDLCPPAEIGRSEATQTTRGRTRRAGQTQEATWTRTSGMTGFSMMVRYDATAFTRSSASADSSSPDPVTPTRPTRETTDG